MKFVVSFSYNLVPLIMKFIIANELRSWLLYYSLPCLEDILPKMFWEHYALLVEGIYLLLQSQIQDSDLVRAELCLKKFYELFSTLYSKNYLLCFFTYTKILLARVAMIAGPIVHLFAKQKNLFCK